MKGFSLFEAAHIWWLISSAVIVAAAAVAGRIADRETNLRISRWLAVAVIFFHFAECVHRMHIGTYGINALPLHICAISSYMVIIHTFRPNRILGELLFCPGIIGAIAAMLYPNWTEYAPLSIMSITCFLAHVFIIAYALHAIIIGLITPSVRRWYIPVIYSAVYAACIIPFDKHFHMNFGFLAGPSPGSPLVALAEVFGYGTGYYVGYALITVTGVFLCYGIYYLIRSVSAGRTDERSDH